MNPKYVCWGKGAKLAGKFTDGEWFQHLGRLLCYDCAKLIESALTPLHHGTGWAWFRGEDVPHQIGYMCLECGKFWDGYERK
jgi:hypothetical protein